MNGVDRVRTTAFTRRLKRYVAGVLRIKPVEIDERRLIRALNSVERRDEAYLDFLVETGNLHGNLPRWWCVAQVYAGL